MKKKLEYKSYIITKALSINKKMKLINKKEFMTVTLNKNIKIFVLYTNTLLATLAMEVYHFCEACIGLLIAEKDLIEILSKYLNYTNFFFDLTKELLENISINKYIIELVES